MKTITYALLLSVAIFGANSALADVVITKDGARLAGTITLIDKDKIFLDTAYAGSIEIAQDQVASFETKDAVNVRLADGMTASGPIEPTAEDSIRIRANEGPKTIETAQIAASWRPGAEDPEVVRNRRVWQYDASVDIDGETGNSEEFEVEARLAARLKGPNDVFGVYIEYEFTEEDNVQTDDRIQGGAGYESFFSEVMGYYIRGELEKDRTEDIDLRALGSGGLSYRLINQSNQSLILRTGAGYETTSFSNANDDVSGATLEFALNHSYSFKDSFRIVSQVVYIPEVEDFDNYRIEFDSGVELPFGRNENWAIGFGIENEYESQRNADRDLETTYYTRLIYSWD